MLIYCLGRLYYSPVAVWLIFGSILAGPAVAWLISQALLHADGLTALTAWSAIDHVLATTLLSGVLWNPVSYSLSPVLDDENRPELRALRAASALLAAGAAVCLVVCLLPRPVLAASTALYVGVSLNASCWWSQIWLHLQAEGLAPLLPASLRETLYNTRPVDWLRSDNWSVMVLHARQVLAVTLLPEADLGHGLALMPPTLRAALESRGLRHVLPGALRTALGPWREGPDGLLRVRPLRLGALRLSLPGGGSVAGASVYTDAAHGHSPSSHAHAPEPPRASRQAASDGGGGGSGRGIVNGGGGAGVNGTLNGGGHSTGTIGATPGRATSAGCAADSRPSNAAAAAARRDQAWPQFEFAAGRAAAMAPEWLILYVLRRHCLRALRTHSARALTSRRTHLLMALAAVALLWARRSADRRSFAPLCRRLLTLMPALGLAYALLKPSARAHEARGS